MTRTRAAGSRNDMDATSDPQTEGVLAQQILERYREAIRASRENEPVLRYGRRTLAVSTLAQQFYCEKAVQFSIERPFAPTAEMQSGTAGHEAVAALGVPMTPEEAVAAAVVERVRPLCVYEFRIGWRHSGVTITGFVDEAWFSGGSVALVAERKFSGSLGIYTPYHVQAGLYCLGLGEMGFGTDSTHYRVSVFKRECHRCERLAAGDCLLLSGEAGQQECPQGAGISQVFPFEREQTVRNLDWAMEFWTGEREAEPTTSPGRCRSCRYRRVCDSSTARSNDVAL